MKGVPCRQRQGAARRARSRDSTAANLPDRKLPLKPGNNAIQVRLSSAWVNDAQPDERTIRYVRPPRIQSVKHELVGKVPFVNLTAEVESPLPVLPDQVMVEVNGKPARFAKVDVQKGKDRLWTVKVQEVPLEVDEDRPINKNSLNLLVANTEDQSPKSEDIPVVYTTRRRRPGPRSCWKPPKPRSRNPS